MFGIITLGLGELGVCFDLYGPSIQWMVEGFVVKTQHDEKTELFSTLKLQKLMSRHEFAPSAMQKTSVIIWGGLLIDSTVVSTAGYRAFV